MEKVNKKLLYQQLTFVTLLGEEDSLNVGKDSALRYRKYSSTQWRGFEICISHIQIRYGTGYVASILIYAPQSDLETDPYPTYFIHKECLRSHRTVPVQAVGRY